MSENTAPEMETVAPTHALVICTSPRSGSYLLSEGLESTQVLGRPQEYFDNHPFKERWWVDRLGIKTEAEYWDKIVARGSTPNGFFGVKLHWFQIADVARKIAAAEGRPPPDDTDLDAWLRRRFAHVHYLWLRRRNTVAQGISYHRAVQTRIWHVREGTRLEAPDRGDPRFQFDFDAIDKRVHQLEYWDDQWQGFFTRHRLKVLMLIYEDFVSSRETYEQSIREVARFAGLPTDGLPIRREAFRRQADALSLEWEEKYRRIRNAMERPSKDVAQAAAMAGTTDPELGPPEELDDDTPSISPPPDRNLPEPSTAPGAAPAPASEGGARASEGEAPTAEGALPLIAYDLNAALGIAIEPAPPRRDWMDAIPNRFAYRCLPLVIANQHGWLLRTPCPISIVWTGGDGLDALKITYPPNEHRRFATSHFGFGILTFAINYIFRTPPGFNLHVRGPANMPKDGIAPLEGIVETDWSEATFTMNWKVTRPYQEIVFEEGEPFAMIEPAMRGEIERFQPEIRSIGENPALEAGFRAWARSRDQFNRDLGVQGSQAQQEGWQRHYVRGETVAKRRADEHQTALSLRDFADKRK